MTIELPKRFILKTALTSRILIITVQYISNLLIQDHHADAFRSLKPEIFSQLDSFVFHVFGGFVRWDAHHFMHIARYGYTYEHSSAFFPLYPLLAQFSAFWVQQLVPCLSLDSCILIAFITINIISFALAALCLYELTVLLANEKLAFTASMLFCFNPASVFFTAPYTESLFSYLTFKSMLNCILIYTQFCNGLKVKHVSYVLPICLSTVTRSNGILNIGFLIYTLMCLCLHKKKNFDVKFTLSGILLVLVCIVPFILFQKYIFDLFCTNFEADLPEKVVTQANTNEFVLPGTFAKHNQTWCFNKIPLAYSYVQSHYWNVGFLEYYKLKQIPNFLLALPIILIAVDGVVAYVGQFPKKLTYLFNFYLLQEQTKTTYVMVVFIIHLTLLTLFCLFNIHVQVTTRILCSASPAIYWFSVNGLSQSTAWQTKDKLILGYYLSYCVIGTILFCNFLPWT